MTKPINLAFDTLVLESKRKLKNGVICEHWHDSIDNYHHLHFPDGTLIVFRHEDSEGSVRIEEK